MAGTRTASPLFMEQICFGSPLNAELLPTLQWIEVASTLQIPSFVIVGLPGPEVAEARERVRAAIQASGFEFPRRRVVLNLSPASIRKQGTGIDLAMALAVLSANNQDKIAVPTSEKWIACGELGLDGTIKPTGQVLRALYASWSAQTPYLLLPAEEAQKAYEQIKLLLASKLLKGEPPMVIPVSTLKQAWQIILDNLSGTSPNKGVHNLDRMTESVFIPPDKIKHSSLLSLTPSLERVLGISVSGSHHILILGPRGAGKSYAMEWLTALQPPLSPDTSAMQTLLAELTFTRDCQGKLPIRRIGTQVRPSALVGTASTGHIRPGEFSLAHGGVLIADEIFEWARDSREALREPLERSYVTLTRSRGTAQLPARFQLAANGNFCPCGGWPSSIPLPSDWKGPACHCSPKAVSQYLSRLSGPVLDRVDIVLRLGIQVSSPKHWKTTPLEDLRHRVIEARERAMQTWGELPGRMSPENLECLLTENKRWKTEKTLTEASSLRSRHKILRLALSLANWEGLVAPTSSHFSEASYYRPERLHSS
jgi:magnesium chelatase family protein